MVRVLLRDVPRRTLGGRLFTVARYNGNQPDRHQLATGATPGYLASGERAEPFIGLISASLKTVYPEHHTVYQNFIQEVFKTLVEAIILVFLVMYLFCRISRAIILMIAVPRLFSGRSRSCRRGRSPSTR